MTEVFVSLLGSKNLSQSMLITRNLYSTLQIGPDTHRATQVEVDDVGFNVSNTADPLIITLRNGQTQTVMYVRNVPLSLITSGQSQVTLWVAVHPPGDPRNLSFDEASPPRPDAPQVQLSLRTSGSAPTGGESYSSSAMSRPNRASSTDRRAPFTRGRQERTPSADRLRNSRDQMPPPQISDQRPSALDREALAIREKERLAQDIKSKVSAMADAQRQAQSTEEQLQDAFRAIEDTRRRVEAAEEELQSLSAQQHVLEREKQAAREGCARARETLRLRETAIMELKASRDEADRQLSQAITARERQREQMEQDNKHFEDEVKSLSQELDRWKAESRDLSDAMGRCDQRLEELQTQGDRSAVATGKSSEELRALQKQYNEALAEMEDVRKATGDEQSKLLQSEEQAAQAQVRLAEAESAAKQARDQLASRAAMAAQEKQSSFEIETEAEVTERELRATISKEAQLQGQIGENSNQLKDMEARMKEFRAQVQTRGPQINDLESTISSLQQKVDVDEGDIQQAETESKTRKSQISKLLDETNSFRSKATELESSRREIELAHTRRVGELESTRRIVDAELGSINGEVSKLREDQQRLATSVAAVEEDAKRRGDDLDQTQAAAKSKEQELTTITAQRAAKEKNRGEVGTRLAELQVELEEARREMTSADAETAKLRDMADAAQTARIAREKELEARVEQLRGDLESKKVEQLRLAEQSVREERDRLKVAVSENRLAVQKQAALVKELQGKMDKQKLELGAASSDVSSGQSRESGLRKSMEDSISSLGEKAKLARGDISEIERQHTLTHSELSTLRAEREERERQASELSSACKDLEDKLSTTNLECQTALSDNAKRLREMEDECAKYEAEESELNRRGAELEGRFTELESMVAEERGKHAKFEADLSAQKRKLGDAKAELETCNNDIVATKAKHAAETACLSELQQKAGQFDSRVTELRNELAAAEAGAERATLLRTELESARKLQRDAREEQGRALGEREADVEKTRSALEEASSNILAAKNAELDHRLERIQNLEKEVMSLSSSIQSTTTVRAQLMERVSSAEAKQQEARSEVMEQEAHLGILRQELQVLEVMKGKFEGKVTSAQARLKVAEDTVALAEKDARERASQLAELSAMAAKATKDHEERVAQVRLEVAAQETQNADSAASVEQTRSESRALRDQRDLARQQLKEKESRYDVLGSTLSQVQLDQQAAEAERKVAAEQAERQLLALQALEEELKQLESTTDIVCADEQTVRLLREQRASRQQQKMAAEAEAREFDKITADLNNELIQLQNERHMIGHKLVNQVEQSSIHSSAIEKLEEDIRALKFEAELLNFGLHDAVQYIDFLQKENSLMKQQVEGLYEGTLQDWWSEVHRIKVMAEVERHKDELGHWSLVVDESEQELLVEVAQMRKRNADIESGWQRKLEALEENLPRQVRKLQELDAGPDLAEVSGSVHSVPAALHGLVSPTRPLPANSQRRKALVIGCNYTRSHRPLQGCSNDVWNVQCLLRHSLQYGEDKVRCFIDGSDFCPSPPSRQPTKANILDAIQWLTSNASPGDNLFLYFSGYGTQQPQADSNGGSYESFLVPSDFADDLPPSFFQYPGQPMARVGSSSPSYRLVPLSEITNALLRLPPMCKVTLVLDCCNSVVPNISSKNPAPAAFRRVAMDPIDHVPRPSGAALSSQPRYLELPPLPIISTRLVPGTPLCFVHCYAACQSEQWCAEFPIEGCVQGAFTWTFVKALTAGHLHTTVQQHGKALHSILAELRHHFRWIAQTPVIQMSGSAKLQDYVLL